MESTMEANVRFRYWAETADEQHTVELTVRAQVDPGTPAVTDRRPEHCHEGEPADVLDVAVLDEDGTGGRGLQVFRQRFRDGNRTMFSAGAPDADGGYRGVMQALKRAAVA